MPALRLLTSVVLTALLPTAVTTQESAPAKKRPACTDLFGDPLPRGALARLGTLRLQPGGTIRFLAFSPDGKRLACWADSYTFMFWDAQTGRELRRIDTEGQVVALRWLANGHGIAVLKLSEDRFYVWDFADEKAALPPAAVGLRPIPSAGNDGSRWSSFAISTDGKRLAAGSCGMQEKDRPIRLWELQLGQSVGDLKARPNVGLQLGDCEGLAFSPDGKRLLALSYASQAKKDVASVWNVSGGLRSQTVLPGGRSPEARPVAASNQAMAVGLSGGKALLWDPTASRQPQLLEAAIPGKPRQGWLGVTSLVFSPDGKTLLTCGHDGGVGVWNVAGRREVRTWQNPMGLAMVLAVSPDGKRLAAGNRGVRLWETATGKDLCALGEERSCIEEVACSPCGGAVALLEGNGTLRLWQPAEGRTRWSKRLGSKVYGLAITPDGKTTATIVEDKLRLYQTADGKPVQPPGGLGQEACGAFRFAANGKAVATAREDKLAVWQWPAGRLVRVFPLPAGKDEERWGSFSLDEEGKRLVAFSMHRFIPGDLPSGTWPAVGAGVLRPARATQAPFSCRVAHSSW